MWSLPLDDLADEADITEAPQRSRWALHEDGLRIGPAHSAHADIAAQGFGMYSHWRGYLRFSTSDNSDPNTNGRRYTLVRLRESVPPLFAPDSRVPLRGPTGGVRRIFPILSVPRSGTWWHIYFLHSYSAALLGEPAPPIEDAPSLWNYGQTLRGFVLIAHAACPGFRRRSTRWKGRAAWNAMEFGDFGYDYAGDFCEANGDLLDPGLPDSPGVVYLYRNPLDHFVSMFDYSVNHVDPRQRGDRDGTGTIRPFLSPFDFAWRRGIERYAKQYTSFAWMAKRYPGRVLMRPYEDLVRAPEAHFRSLFGFFGWPLDETAFRAAFDTCRYERLRGVEEQLGRPLAGLHADLKTRHLRDGRTGKWRERFSDAELAVVKERFAGYGIDLRDFDLDGAGPAICARTRPRRAANWQESAGNSP